MIGTSTNQVASVPMDANRRATHMCNRYETPTQIEVERYWHLGRENAPKLWPRAVFPRAPGPFIRRARNVTGYERELVVGQ